MEVVSGGGAAGVPDVCDRGARLDYVALLLEKASVMLVGGYDVSAVLYGDGVSVFVAPAGVDHGAVQAGLDYAVRRSGDVHCGVRGQIEAVRDDAHQRRKEMHAFDGKVTLRAGRKAELLLFLDLGTEDGILLLKVLRALLLEVGDDVRIVGHFFQGEGLFSAQGAVDVGRIEFPAYHRALQRVDLDGVVEGLAAEIGIRITGYGVVERGEDQQRVDASDQDTYEEGQDGEEAQAAESYGIYLFVGGVLHQSKSVSFVLIFFTSHTFAKFAAHIWTES